MSIYIANNIARDRARGSHVRNIQSSHIIKSLTKEFEKARGSHLGYIFHREYSLREYQMRVSVVYFSRNILRKSTNVREVHTHTHTHLRVDMRVPGGGR